MKEFYLETDRLKLFPLRPELSQQINGLILNTFDTLHPWMSFAQYPPTVEETNQFFISAYHGFMEKKKFHMAIFLKDEQKFIGSCGTDDSSTPLEPINGVIPYNIGYWLHKDYTGHGYVTEAVKSLIRYVHEEMNVKIFSINCLKDNLSSANVAERLDFTWMSTSEIPLVHNRTDWPEKVLCKIFILQFD